MPNEIRQEASTEQKKLAIIRLLQILEEEVESQGKENETLLESQDLIDTDDLPLPEDLAPNKDFTKNE